MFYYMALDKKYVISKIGKDIKSIFYIDGCEENKPVLKEVSTSSRIMDKIYNGLRDGNNRGFFNINELLEYAVEEGNDLIKSEEKQSKLSLNDEIQSVSMGNVTISGTTTLSTNNNNLHYPPVRIIDPSLMLYTSDPQEDDIQEDIIF